MNKLKRLFTWTWNNWRILTFKKIANFFQAYYRILYYRIFKDHWIEDQVAWREVQVTKKSPACLTRGACIHCGCDMPDKLYETDSCEAGCYPNWMSIDEWVKVTTNEK